MMKEIVAAFALATAAISSHAGPFGLNFGESYAKLSKLGLIRDRATQWYAVRSVSSPHRDFDEYRVLISPKFGLCKIVAFANKIQSDVYGTRLREKYESLEEALSKKYGEGKKYDRLKVGSIWNEPRDFMMGLAKDERILSTFWTGVDSATHDGVTSVSLKADATSSSIGFIALSYESKDIHECLEAAKEESNSSL